MVNNVAKTNQVLNTSLGGTTSFTSKDDVTLLTGEIGTGLLVFDSSGTVGAVSTFTDENNFIVTTYALSLDIPTILGQSY